MEASKLSESSGAAVQLLSWRPHGMPMAFVVHSIVSRGSEGADLQCASLYASYLLRSRCPSQCAGVRAPGVWSAEPRACLPLRRSISVPPTARAVVRRAPLSGALDGVAPPGAAPGAPVGPRRPGSVCHLLGGLGRRAVPASGAARLLSRRRSPKATGTPELRIFELPESGGHQDTPRVPGGTKQDRLWQWIWADDGGVRSTLRVRPPS
ncbi:hypothetical protein NDU88_001844 [Pleurodeles waltl]|uniref:Uncharacterized protein n=1 Tax=Pleurodeles waltl TaxID=8319 RepID=A0AAV7T0L5_PLEWA|nr:hypothetical protein NDU88_001844 [Pleurodeles waltl]